MVNSLSSRGIKMRIGILATVIIMVVAWIVYFQIMWIDQTFQKSQKNSVVKLKYELSQIIDEYKLRTADSVRVLLKEILATDTSFNFLVSNDNYGRTAWFRHEQSAYTTFRLTDGDKIISKKEAHNFLLAKVNEVNLDKLRSIYSSLVGVRTYLDPYEDNLQLRLSKYLNEKYSNEPLLKIVADDILESTKVGDQMSGRINSYKDASVFLKIPVKEKRAVDSSQTATGIVEMEITETLPQRMGAAMKLEMMNAHLDSLNKLNDSVYVAQAMLDELNYADELPIIVLAVKIPDSMINQQSVSLAIMVALQLLFLGGCIVYMFYLIITQKKLADIKNDFINNMSHELKTPISTALAAVQGMQHFNVLEDPQKTSLYLQTTEGELKKLTSMVSKILNNAVFENGSFEIRKQQFDLKVALEELIANHKMINPNASIHLNYTGNEIITGDETYLKIALSNLIDNGIKYAEKDPVLVIECVNALEGIQISVKDNGQGITKDYQERIFEQYFRVPKPDDHSVKGHGLGLAYSRSIIKKHSGTIQLKGSDESGSTFFIFLPK